MMNDAKPGFDFAAGIEFHAELEGRTQEEAIPVTSQPNEPGVANDITPAAVSDAQNAIPAAPPLPQGFVALSHLLQGIPVGERSKILEDFDAGIESGTIIAVRRQCDRFPVEFIATTGRQRTREIADWMIMDTPRFQDWVKRQRSESHYAAMMARGVISVSEDEILLDPDHFKRLAKMHREILKKKRGAGTKRLKTTAVSGDEAGVSG